jgi:hypothetical protein
MTSPVEVRPDRPSVPVCYFQWMVGECVVVKLPARAVGWSLCITSIHTSYWARRDEDYASFSLTQYWGDPTLKREIFVQPLPPGRPISWTFPTPLVIESDIEWELVASGPMTGALTPVNITGFFGWHDVTPPDTASEFISDFTPDDATIYPPQTDKRAPTA